MNLFKKRFLIFSSFVFAQASFTTTTQQIQLIESLAKTCPSPFPKPMHQGADIPVLEEGIDPRWGQEQVGLPETWALANTMIRSSAINKYSSIAVHEEETTLRSFSELRTHGPFIKIEAPHAPNKISESSNVHNELVSHVAAGESITGAAPLAKLSLTLKYGDPVPDWLTPESSFYPRVINMSHSPLFTDKKNVETYVEEVKKFTDASIVVRAMGNYFPSTIPKGLYALDIIHTGATSPAGQATKYSSESSLVDVTAPSGILSKNDYGQFEKVDGTSFSAPLVAGSIANVVTVLEYNTTSRAKLAIDEVRALLQKTSIGTSTHLDSRGMNGAGSLNSYKLIRVAMRLQENWPQNRHRIKEDSGLYDFRDEASTYKQNALEMLNGKNLCKDLPLILKTLRLSFFLNSEDKEVRALLASIYKDYGRREEAKFYNVPQRDKKLEANRALLSGVSHGRVDWIKSAEGSLSPLGSLDAETGSGYGSLYWKAIRNGNLETIEHLHSRGARITSDDDFSFDYSIVKSCSELGVNNVIKILNFLKRTQPEEFQNILKKSGIIYRVVGMSEEDCPKRRNLVTWLALAGADIDRKNDISMSNAMQLASSNRDEEMKILLSELGAAPLYSMNIKSLFK